MGQIKDKLQELINRTDLNDSQIWDIISALRGPDNEDSILKTATTEVIRHKLGFYEQYFFVSPDDYNQVIYRKGMNVGSHFYLHARSAFRALGLNWNDVNL